MNINYKEPQFELFPANSATLEDINKPKFLLASLTLSTENLVILIILGIMVSLFSFSIGVERGRSLAAQSLDEKVAAVWNVGGRRLAIPPVTNPTIKAPVAVSSTTRISGNGGVVHSTVLPRAINTKPSMVKALPAPTVLNSASSSSKWTVQLATYRNENFAQQEALGLKSKGYPTFIIKSKDFFLICVGQFASQAQADVFFKKIQVKHHAGQVRRF